MTTLDSKIPQGPLADKWTNYKATQRLVNPANKRKLDIIVVGTGLAGASASASLGELGHLHAGNADPLSQVPAVSVFQTVV